VAKTITTYRRERWDWLSQDVIDACLLIPSKLENGFYEYDQAWEIAQQMQAIEWGMA